MYSNGYKIGGFNKGLTANNIGEEEVGSWEMGHKGNWLKNKLRVDLAIFSNQYKDLQLGQNIGGGATNQSIVQNVGSATTRGLEIEYEWLLYSQLRISGYYSHLFSEYGSLSLPDPNTNAAQQIDVTGNRLIKAPKNQFNLQLTKSWKLNPKRILEFSLNAFFQDKIYFTAFNDEISSAPNFMKFDTSIRLFRNDKKWLVNIFTKNLGNKNIPGEMSTAGGATLGVYEPSREFGINLNLKI